MIHRIMTAAARFVFAVLLTVAFGAIAQAHPHVWVKVKSELIYAPDGTVTGVRHTWAFDDMFSAFATQGLEQKKKGEFTREELAPLAKVNIDSLKENDYFTFATADGEKTAFVDPRAGEYWLDYKNEVITLHFVLPFKQPVKARALDVEVYDPGYFVDFSFIEKNPVALSGAPAACKLTFARPKEMSFGEGKKLSESFFNDPAKANSWGANFANKITVNCP